MDIHWYPGHMTGAMRKMQEDIKLVDCVIELVDARIPFSSKNPDLDKLAANKKRIIIFNKADLADASVTEQWKTYYEEREFYVLTMDARNRKSTQAVTKAVQTVCAEKIERDKRRGIANRPIKAMVVGIPNVGKSTFINSYVGKASAKTGNKPGVTKGNQWIRISKNINLLDTPGVLWPKFENQTIALNIALIGSINDNILEISEISLKLIEYLQKYYCKELSDRYKLVDGDAYQVLCGIADEKKCVLKGGEPDIEKASKLLLDDFRSGRLGRITLERPDDINS